MNVKLRYHSYVSRKRKIIKARRKAKNAWSKKKMLENSQHYVSKMLKLGAHFFNLGAAPQKKITPVHELKK
jgi:hypothetical protein